MQPQERGYSCGPAALRSALYVLGRNVQEAALRRKARTTSDGTDEKDLIVALSHYGFRHREMNESSIHRAWYKLKSNLDKGRPSLLCVDSWNHWVSVVAVLGKKVLVFDPLKPAGRQRKYSGLKVYSEFELAERWSYVEDGGKQYYSLVIF